MSDDHQVPSPRASSGARRAPAAAPHSRRGRPRARRDGGLPGVASDRDHEPRRLVPLDSDACLRGACRHRPRPVRLQPVGRRRAAASPRPAWGSPASPCSFRPSTRGRRSWCRPSPRRSRSSRCTRPGSSTTASGRRSRAGGLARCPVPRAADARARQGGERQLRAWRRRRRDPGGPGCRSRRRARLPAATLGYFGDKRVALVQTPQDFYNVTLRARQRAGLRRAVPRADPLLSAAPAREEPVERGLLVRHQRARPSRGAPRGRRRSNRHDHRGHPHDHPHAPGGLADGLSQRGAGAGPRADDAGQYQLQRNRWGTGAMQVLQIENPLTARGLTLGQRLGYAATLLGWFDAWRTLGFLALPPLVLISGSIPIIADGLTFAIAFGVTYGLQQAALYLLGRGAYRPILSIVFDLVRMSPNFLATLSLFTSRKPRFRVTPKGRMAASRGRIEAPIMLRAALAASFVGATGLRPPSPERLLDRLRVRVGRRRCVRLAGHQHGPRVGCGPAGPIPAICRRASQCRALRGRHPGHGRRSDGIGPGRLGRRGAACDQRAAGRARDAPGQLRAAGRNDLDLGPHPLVASRRERRVPLRASSSSPGNTPPRAHLPVPSSSAVTRLPAPSGSHGAKCSAGRSARSRDASSGPHPAPTPRRIPSMRWAPPPRSRATPSAR